jgi:hypothetical protein
MRPLSAARQAAARRAAKPSRAKDRATVDAFYEAATSAGAGVT